MTHRADQISDAIVSILAAADDIGVPSSAVFKDRSVSMLEDFGEIPAINVAAAEDSPTSEEGNDNVSFIDSILTIEVVGYATGAAEREVKAELMAQRRAIHRALMADPTLGLEFVIATKYGGASKVDLNGNGQSMAGSLLSNWRVHYRMNFSDPGD